MKRNFYTLILMLYLAPVFAQNKQISTLPEKDTFVKGRKTNYYISNNLIYEIMTKRGVLDGVSKIFYRSRKLLCQFGYKKGVLHGPNIAYYETGNISDEQYYKDGKKHGEFKEYYPSGKLLKKTVFLDGAFQNSYFYDEFDKAYLIGEKGMFYAKKTDKGYLPAFLYNHFKELSYKLGENVGNVYLKITIDTEGKAKDLRLINIQDSNTLSTLSKEMYKLSQNLPLFIPAKKDGVPLESTILVTLQQGFSEGFSNYPTISLGNSFYPNMSIPHYNSHTHDAQRFLMRQSSPSFPRDGW